MLWRAVEYEEAHSESSSEDTSGTFAQERLEDATKKHRKKEKKERAELSAEAGLQSFFQRTRAISRIVHVLQSDGGEWGSELQKALESSPMSSQEQQGGPLDAQLLVSQILH